LVAAKQNEAAAISIDRREPIFERRGIHHSMRHRPLRPQSIVDRINSS
jgi:hypothetical protein